MIGGRPLPNILAVFYLKPDYHYIIASEDSVQDEVATNSLPAKYQPTIKPIKVKPYQPEETYNAIQSIVSKHNQDEIIIISGSEPKSMTLGAYNYFLYRRKEVYSMQFAYIAREGLLWIDDLKSSGPYQLTIGLKDYFNSYGWNIKWKEKLPDEFDKIASLLKDDIKTSCNLLFAIKNPISTKDKYFIPMYLKTDSSEFKLLENIAQVTNALIEKENQQNHIKFIINNKEYLDFLTGKWLEYVVWQEASSLNMFDECGWGIEDQNKRSDKLGEIDFAGVFSGQLIIASCKTKKRLERTDFEEIDSRRQQLGGKMCSPMLITTILKNDLSETKITQLKKWTDSREIVLVMGENLKHLNKILIKIIKQDKNLPPDDIPCFRRI